MIIDDESIAFNNINIINTNIDFTIEKSGFSTPSISLSTRLIEK